MPCFANGCHPVNIWSCATLVFLSTIARTMAVSAWTANQSESEHSICIKLGKSETNTFEMIRQVYVKKAVKHASCFEWHSHFKNGKTSLQDEERCRISSKVFVSDLLSSTQNLCLLSLRPAVHAEIADVLAHVVGKPCLAQLHMFAE